MAKFITEGKNGAPVVVTSVELNMSFCRRATVVVEGVNLPRRTVYSGRSLTKAHRVTDEWVARMPSHTVLR